MTRAFIFVAVALVSACGGAASPSMAAPSNDSTPSNVASPEATGGGTARAPEVSAARGELDRAERQLGSAQGDCASACRALASMERAANHICALEAGSECGKARDRVEAARERIRSTCGACAP